MDNVIEKIEASLDKIRPFLQTDGGDVRIVDFNEDGVLTLELVGNCNSCSMNNMTFKNGIQDNVIRDVPEVKEVRATNLIMSN